MHQFPKIAQIQKKCPFFTGLHLKRARRTKSRSPKGLRLVDTIISMRFWDWIGLNSVTIVGHKSEKPFIFRQPSRYEILFLDSRRDHNFHGLTAVGKNVGIWIFWSYINISHKYSTAVTELQYEQAPHVQFNTFNRVCKYFEPELAHEFHINCRLRFILLKKPRSRKSHRFELT